MIRSIFTYSLCLATLFLSTPSMAQDSAGPGQYCSYHPAFLGPQCSKGLVCAGNAANPDLPYGNCIQTKHKDLTAKSWSDKPRPASPPRHCGYNSKTNMFIPCH